MCLDVHRVRMRMIQLVVALRCASILTLMFVGRRFSCQLHEP